MDSNNNIDSYRYKKREEGGRKEKEGKHYIKLSIIEKFIDELLYHLKDKTCE